MFMETNPIPVKAALAIKGVISTPAVRLPLLPASRLTVEKIRELIEL
jgi:dihydrodipicolinate synthase/N-acetylneuraminate lyase